MPAEALTTDLTLTRLSAPVRPWGTPAEAFALAAKPVQGYFYPKCILFAFRADPPIVAYRRQKYAKFEAV